MGMILDIMLWIRNYIFASTKERNGFNGNADPSLGSDSLSLAYCAYSKCFILCYLFAYCGKCLLILQYHKARNNFEEERAMKQTEKWTAWSVGEQ